MRHRIWNDYKSLPVKLMLWEDVVLAYKKEDVLPDTINTSSRAVENTLHGTFGGSPNLSKIQ